MPVDTKNWQIPSESGYTFRTPYVNKVEFQNSTVLCALDPIAHDKENNSNYALDGSGRMQDFTTKTFSLVDDFHCYEGMEVQFGADIVGGATGHRDNNNVCIVSANPWSDGKFYKAVVSIGGGVQNPQIMNWNPILA